ncbi:hypothetical protein CHS0354_041160 [Potamilus streckersoni]|uniref:Uncharacterized protein n=1 Tax=Potamilus streckersoni TaxID=2493646 RepID=A0AAE0VTJ7_9BIVA|nr:hypothetical protein CHS0354_041160 [Potamilus streckersoni]
MSLYYRPLHGLILISLFVTPELLRAFGALVGDINNSIKTPSRQPRNDCDSKQDNKQEDNIAATNTRQ